jgi:hypothetical protein
MGQLRNIVPQWFTVGNTCLDLKDVLGMGKGGGSKKDKECGKECWEECRE